MDPSRNVGPALTFPHPTFFARHAHERSRKSSQFSENRRGPRRRTALAGLDGSMPLAAEVTNGAPNAEKLGWRLGCGSWTFHVYTLFEAIDKTAALGLKYFETGPHPKLSREQPNVAFDEDVPASVRQAVKQKLADSGLKLVSYGMISYTKDLTRKTFDFAKDMGAEMILSEPRGAVRHAG